MHPNVYLRTFWRSSFRQSVFVAMSFAELYHPRYKEIIEPAIEAVTHRGVRLKAVRVDLSKTGDSILTDIIDGIAHSRLVLADVSVVGHDSKTGLPYRNGNVMYEVGLALACRQSAEVLLIRDDNDRFLFDVSTIPHKHLNFAEPEKARSLLTEEIEARLREIDHIHDARLTIAVATLTSAERQLIAAFGEYGVEQTFWLTTETLFMPAAIARLLDKQLILTAGVTHDRHATFQWTELGRSLADQIEQLMPTVNLAPVEAAGTETTAEPPNGET